MDAVDVVALAVVVAARVRVVVVVVVTGRNRKRRWERVESKRKGGLINGGKEKMKILIERKN